MIIMVSKMLDDLNLPLYQKVAPINASMDGMKFPNYARTGGWLKWKIYKWFPLRVKLRSDLEACKHGFTCGLIFLYF